MKPLESFVGQPVRSLQTMLRVLAQNDSRQPRVIPDGIYGRQTQNAVSSFQKNNNLPVTGVANLDTMEKIADAYASAVVHHGPAQPIQLVMNPGTSIRRGDSGYNVYMAQLVLLALAEIYSSLAAPVLTGILDEQTAEALIAFQYLSALPQTGEIDKITWKHLALHYPLAVNHQESKNITRRQI